MRRAASGLPNPGGSEAIIIKLTVTEELNTVGGGGDNGGGGGDGAGARGCRLQRIDNPDSGSVT